MNKPVIIAVAAFLALMPAARCQQPKAKVIERPVLELKIFSLTEAEPEMTAGVLSALLGDNEIVLVKAKKPDEEDKTAPLWRCVADARTRSLIFRGSATHLAIAEDVVALLNRKEDQPLPATKTVLALALKHTNAGEVANAVNALEFENLKMSQAGETLLLIVAAEETRKQVETVVKALDVPAKEEK